jgi:recombinational DNA repair protein RecR
MLAPLQGRPGFPSGFPSVHVVGKESKVHSTSVALNLFAARNTCKSCKNCQEFERREKIMTDFASIRQRANEALAMIAGAATRAPFPQ